jgi:hypothetical protein
MGFDSENPRLWPTREEVERAQPNVRPKVNDLLTTVQPLGHNPIHLNAHDLAQDEEI